MLSVTPLICDRRVYDKKGKWLNPLTKIVENVFYFEKEARTMVSTYVNGREELKETLTITVYGGKPFAKGDKIALETGEEFRIEGYIPKYFESNPLVKDLVKPLVAEMDLILE